MSHEAIPVEFRPARPGDAEALAHLNDQLGYPVEAGRLATRLEALADDDTHELLVAESANRVLGWVHVLLALRVESDPFAEIAGLVVDANARRRGIGKRLVERCEDWARERGLRRIRVRSNVVRADAHRFYERLGFRETKRQSILDKDLSDSV